MTIPIDVTGGPGDVAAQFDDLASVSGQFRHWSDELAAIAADLRQLTSDASFVRSSGICPEQAATRDALVDALLIGPRGVPATAADLHQLAAAILDAVLTYQRTEGDGFLTLKTHSSPVDALLGLGWDAIRFSPPMLPVTAIRTGQQLSHPSAASAAGLDDMLNALSVVHGSYDGARTDLALQYDDGHPTVSLQGGASTVSAATPSGQLDKLEQISGAPDSGVGIELTANPDGTRSVTVFVPGVRDWDLGGAARGAVAGPLMGARVRSHDVRDVGTTLRAMGGEPTSYEAGVLQAMRQAGVRPDDHVMLVGHSLGGVVAANVATRTAATGEFHVTHVLTAGSPDSRALRAVPKSVRVLALENPHDVVPLLDGSENPRRTNTTTVTGEGAFDSYGDAHGVRKSYEPIAEAAQGSGHPSVQDFLDSAGEYYRQAPADAQFYGIRRDF